MRALLVGLLVAAGTPSFAQGPVLDAQGFRRASVQNKRMTMNALAAHRVSPAPEALVELLEAGLEDAEPSVRLTAAYATAGRAGAARFGRDAAKRNQWNAERSTLLRLRPALIVRVDDPDPKVRQAVVIALVNMEYDGSPALDSIRLGQDVATAFAKRFPAEKDPLVRAEIAKTFALMQAENAQHEAIVLAGLADSDARVIQYAVLGAARSRPAAALPTIVEMLGRPEQNVRLQAAQALAAYGPPARAYLARIEGALAAERDPIIRKSLEATVDLLRNPQTLAPATQ